MQLGTRASNKRLARCGESFVVGGLLPTLASLDEQRDPQSDLKQLWKNVARELTALALDSCQDLLNRSSPGWRTVAGPNQTSQ